MRPCPPVHRKNRPSVIGATLVAKVLAGSSVEVLATEGLGDNLATATVTLIAEA